MPTAPNDRGVTPESLGRAKFATTFRGFDQDEVRAFLNGAAEALRVALDEAEKASAELDKLRARAAGELDEAEVTSMLGEETARVLTTAREAAAEMRKKAEEAGARLIRAAQEEAVGLRTAAQADADRVRGEAATVLQQRTTEAQAAASKITERAEAEAARLGAEAAEQAAGVRQAAEQVMAEAQAAAEKVRQDAVEAAEQALVKARTEGGELLREAQLMREGVLRDLSRKRKTARSQLEQLRAGRERLLDAYDVVRKTVDDATTELKGSLSEAKIAADAAVRRVEAEAEPSVEELEAEVVAAREAGLVVLDEPTPADVAVPESVVAVDAESPASEPATESAAPSVPTPPTTPIPIAAPASPPTSMTELPPLPEEIPPPPPTMQPIDPPRTGRRRRGTPQLPPTRLQPMSPRDPVEGMRVITGEVPAVQLTSATGEPASEAADAAHEHEPTEVATALESVDQADGVGDLFARMRAARTEAVARAEEVLATPTPEAADAAEDSAPVPTEEDAGAEDVAGASEDEALLERRDAVVDEIEQRLIRKLRRVLADEQSAALDALRRSRSPGVDSLYADGLEAQLALWGEAAAPELSEAAAAGSTFHGEAGTPPASTTDLSAELASDLVKPLRDRVESSLRDANGDEETAAEGIRAAYRDWKARRIADAARDVVIAAFARGMFDAAGEGMEMRWLVDDGAVPCSDCEDDALAGALAKGTPFPTGHSYPPAHPGCRCLLVPVAT